MNYELAKELKEAGFPFVNDFKEYGYLDHPKDHVTGICHTSIVAPDEGYFLPTLSELIEACGEDFKGLTKLPDGTFSSPLTNPSEGKYEPFDMLSFKTPEEAVAKLWLALNKNV